MLADASRNLDQLQRWMQAVITHPDGVTAGISCRDAQQQINVHPEDIEQVVRRSRNQSSIERLQVYAGAYYARLLECLREEFRALAHALDKETFDGFAVAYLQAYPSTSYTLANLGRYFPEFLMQTRPVDTTAEGGGATWPDLLIDLVCVERTYSEVFDGPGIENERVLQAEDLADIAPQQWPAARLMPVPCLRLLSLRYPVHEYISAVRHNTEAILPGPAPTYLVITRRDYMVRRCSVSQGEYELLSALVAGETIGDAIERAATAPGMDLDSLAAQLQQWFAAWAKAAYFQKIELPD